MTPARQDDAMRQAIALCLSTAKGLRWFRDDCGLMFADLISSMAANPGEAARFAKILRDTSLFSEWPGWDQIRALWCQHIGTPRDGIRAELRGATPLIGEQPVDAFPGCPACVNGWRQRVIVKGCLKYTASEECDCRRRAVLEAGVTAGAKTIGEPARRGSDSLQRADVRALLEGKVK